MNTVRCNNGCEFLVMRNNSVTTCDLPTVINDGKILDFCQEHVAYLGSIGGLIVDRPQIELFKE